MWGGIQGRTGRVTRLVESVRFEGMWGCPVVSHCVGGPLGSQVSAADPGSGITWCSGLRLCSKEGNLDNQQGPTVQHRELYSIFCNNLNGKRI